MGQSQVGTSGGPTDSTTQQLGGNTGNTGGAGDWATQFSSLFGGRPATPTTGAGGGPQGPVLFNGSGAPNATDASPTTGQDPTGGPAADPSHPLAALRGTYDGGAIPAGTGGLGGGAPRGGGRGGLSGGGAPVVDPSLDTRNTHPVGGNPTGTYGPGANRGTYGGPGAAPAAPASPAPASGGLSASSFGANPYLTNPTGTNAYAAGTNGGLGGATTNYNPGYFASNETAQMLAKQLGGTVVGGNDLVNAPGSPFTLNQPEAMIKLPNGLTINAGTLAQIYGHGYGADLTDQMLANELNQGGAGQGAYTVKNGVPTYNANGTNTAMQGISAPTAGSPATMANTQAANQAVTYGLAGPSDYAGSQLGGYTGQVTAQQPNPANQMNYGALAQMLMPSFMSQLASYYGQMGGGNSNGLLNFFGNQMPQQQYSNFGYGQQNQQGGMGGNDLLNLIMMLAMGGQNNGGGPLYSRNNGPYPMFP